MHLFGNIWSGKTSREREGAYLGLGLTQPRHDSATISAKQKEASFEIGLFLFDPPTSAVRVNVAPGFSRQIPT